MAGFDESMKGLYDSTQGRVERGVPAVVPGSFSRKYGRGLIQFTSPPVSLEETTAEELGYGQGDVYGDILVDLGVTEPGGYFGEADRAATKEEIEDRLPDYRGSITDEGELNG